MAVTSVMTWAGRASCYSPAPPVYQTGGAQITVSVFRFLDAEAAPHWCLPLDRDDLRASMEQATLALVPTIDMSEGQPTSSILDVVATYIALSAQLHSNAGNSTLRRFAVGQTLDLLGAELGIARIQGESDALYRDRQDSVAARAPTTTAIGLEAAVLGQTNLAEQINDLNFAYDATSGAVTVTILSTEDATPSGSLRGTPPTALRTAVVNYLQSPAVVSLGLSVFTAAVPTIVQYDLALSIAPNPGVSAADAQQAIRDALEAWENATYRLGNAVTQQAIYNTLIAVQASISISSITRVTTGTGLTPGPTTAYLLRNVTFS